MSRDRPYVSSASKAVFLSYASQDAEAAQHICDALRAMNVEVWFDQSELRGGDAWDALIRRQIRECALFVPVISTNTQSRSEGYFRLEWKLAVDRSHLIADDQAFLVPVVIDSTVDEAARVPDKFREVQWTRLSADAAFAAFADHLYRLLNGTALALVAPARPGSVPASTVRAQPLSIAVLPFVNRSRAEEDEYFSDGLADELLNVLAKIRGLRVAARSSAYAFKGKGAVIAEVGRALNVATILEGSVRKSGNRMRISVQLVKVADGYHLWSQTYDRLLEDIFAVQDDIAQSVVAELRTALFGETEAKAGQQASAQVAAAAKGRTNDPEAHRLFLQARYLILRLTRDDVTTGIAYLKQALELEPALALAWAKLASAYSTEVDLGWVPAVEGVARAREALDHALALEPDLAQGHAQMGWIRMYYDWDWRAAEASLQQAQLLAPGNPDVLLPAGAMALTLGRIDDAIELFRQVVAHDPLRASGYSNLGMALNAGDRLVESESAYRKAVELGPQREDLRANLALNLLAQGRVDEALAEALREPHESIRFWAIAIIEHAAGHFTESDVALQKLITKSQGANAYQVAEVYAARGEIDVAFQWLERAYAQRDGGLAEIKTNRLFRSLHTDLRWRDFMCKMRLAD